MLYVRMLLTMLVSLYTSRIVLNTLGAEDYGIYNVVGGMVVMFNFLNTSMAIAVQRYLSFEIGQGNFDRLKNIFSLSLIIHIVLAIGIVIFAGAIGMWLIDSQLKIPVERLSATYWVFYLAIGSCCANVIRIPYNAVIIAREKMDIYAYMSILEVLLNLCVAYMLCIGNMDKLKLYAVLICIVSWVITFFYQIYCRRKYAEVRHNFYWDKPLFKELLSFAGWSALGEIAWVMTLQGVNLVLNIFFGPIVNAARGIAYQVTGAVNRFVASFQTAVNPQLIKYYAANDTQQMFVLLFRSTSFSYYLLLFFAIPILIETNEILRFWLKNVPEYTVVFCRLAVIGAMVDTLSNLLATAAKAYGKIRFYQIWVSFLLIANLPLSYIALKLGAEPEFTFYIYIFISLVLLFVRCYLLHRMITLPIFAFLKEVIRAVLVSWVAFILPMVVCYWLSEGLVRLVMVTIVSAISIVLSVYFIGLHSNEKQFFRKKLLNILKWK